MSGPSGTRVTAALRCEEALGEEVDRVLLDGAGPRLREVGAVEAGLAVRVGCDDELADQGLIRSGSDRHIGAPGELEHAQRVGRHLLDRLVAGDRRDAQDLDLGAGQGEQERDRVVLARVAVDEHGDHARTASGISTATARPSRPLASSASTVKAVTTDSASVGDGSASPRAAAANASSSSR